MKVAGFPVRTGFVLSTGLVYAGLGDLLYGLALRPSPAGPAEYASAGVLALAAAGVFAVSTTFVACRGPVRHRVPRTVLHASAAAGLGALVVLREAGIRPEWGGRCSRCDPVGMVWMGTGAAVLAGAALATGIARLVAR